MYPDKQRNSWRLVIIIALIAVLALVLLVILTHKGSRPKTQISTQNGSTSYDANSGETVHTINGEHGNTGVSNDTPIFLGTDQLINTGLTTDQLTNVETAFYRYSMTLPHPIQQVSITSGSAQTNIVNRGQVNQENELNFLAVIDKTSKVSATVQCTGISSITLQLFGDNGMQIYDSGLISGSGN